jgi:RNA polymerase sigma-70 factor, ECF subfamily
MDQESTEQLARLWTQAQPVVSSYVLSLVRDFHQAEDILQQVAVILVREFEKYDSTRPFLPWSLGIAKNVALKSRRDSVRNAGQLLNSELVDQLQAAFEQDLEVWGSLRQALHACLEQQKGRLREALRWRYSMDMKPQSIAEKMGTTAGAVRVMLHRARAVLRECIRRRMSASV